MMAVGENDPERLAMLLSKLLGSEQKRKQEDERGVRQDGPGHRRQGQADGRFELRIG